MAHKTDTLPDVILLYEEIVRMALLYQEEGGGYEEELEALYEYALFLHSHRDDERALEVCTLLDSFYDPEDPDPDRRDNRARLNNFMGQVHMKQEEYEDAEARFKASLDLYRALADEGEDAEPEVAELCGHLAEVMQATYRHGAAARLALECLTRYFQLEQEEPGDYTLELAEACRRLAPFLDGRKTVPGTPPHPRAREFAVCMNALFDCALDRDGAHEAERSVALDTLAGLVPEIAFPDQGARLLREAEDEARRKMEEADSLAGEPAEEYTPSERVAVLFPALTALSQTDRKEKTADASYEAVLAGICDHKAWELISQNRMEEAEVLARRALELYELLAEADPSAYEPDLAVSYHRLGNAIARTRRPKESEAVYRKALEIFQRLAAENPSKYEWWVAKSCHNLAILIKNYARYDEAEEYYRESLDIYRRMAEKDPASYAVYMLHVCRNYAILLVDLRRPAEAEALYREGLDFYEKHGDGGFDGELLFANTKCSLANLLRKTGRPVEADGYFREALDSLRSLSARNPGAAEPWLAQVCNNYAVFLMRNRRDLAAAVKLLEEAVDLYHKYPHEEKREAQTRSALSSAKQMLWEQQGLQGRYVL